MIDQVAYIGGECLVVRSLAPLAGKGRCFGVQRRIVKCGLSGYVIVTAFYGKIPRLIL